MDWKKIIATAAPGLATALGGPLAGGVVSILADKVLGGSSGDAVADEAKLAGVLAGGITPELRAKILEADQAFRLEVLKAGTRELEVAAEDRASAREREAKTGDTLTPRTLAMLVTLGFFGVLAYLLAAGKPQTGGDALLVMLGALGGAWASVISYYFGSSASSAAKTEMMARR